MTAPTAPSTMPLRPLAVLLLLATLAGCMPMNRLPRPPRSGGQTGGGQPGPLPTYGDAPDARPVVVTGANLDALADSDPADVVAFAYARGGWRQIPVQVDERFVYDVAVAYRGMDLTRGEDVFGQALVLGYADPGTLVGPDPDAGLDADDEVALMLMDFGDEGTGHPEGVAAGSGVEIAATAGGATRYAYLYRRLDTRLDPAAGAGYVRYDPVFERGPYRQTYNREGRRARQDPPLIRTPTASNPENTTVRTDFYTLGFSDRWIMNSLQIEGGPDILDVDMFGFVPGECGRSPYSASIARGAFLVNKDGPVRGIRRVVGFNSGPLAEMQWVFYQRLAESTATPRVHQIPGLLGYFDLSPEAEGMRFRAAGTDWVTIDGQPDRLGSPSPEWGMVTGRQGSYAVDYEVQSSGFRLPPVEAFYLDDATPNIQPCLLDGAFYGANGVWVHGRIPNTDPGRGRAAEITARRRIVFGGDPEEALGELQAGVRVQTRAARGGA